MKEVYLDAKSARRFRRDGMMTISCGFGLCGIAETLSDAILMSARTSCSPARFSA